MIGFIDEHREAYGVEPICNVLPIAPSTYHERVAQRQDPSRLSERAKRDRDLKPEIARVFAENFAVYGVLGNPQISQSFPRVGAVIDRVKKSVSGRTLRRAGQRAKRRADWPQLILAFSFRS